MHGNCAMFVVFTVMLPVIAASVYTTYRLPIIIIIIIIITTTTTIIIYNSHTVGIPK